MPTWVFKQAQLSGKLLEACFQVVLRLNTEESLWQFPRYHPVGPVETSFAQNSGKGDTPPLLKSVQN